MKFSRASASKKLLLFLHWMFGIDSTFNWIFHQLTCFVKQTSNTWRKLCFFLPLSHLYWQKKWIFFYKNMSIHFDDLKLIAKNVVNRLQNYVYFVWKLESIFYYKSCIFKLFECEQIKVMSFKIPLNLDQYGRKNWE